MAEERAVGGETGGDDGDAGLDRRPDEDVDHNGCGWGGVSGSLEFTERILE